MPGLSQRELDEAREVPDRDEVDWVIPRPKNVAVPDFRIGRPTRPAHSSMVAVIPDARLVLLEPGHLPWIGLPAAVASPILERLRRTVGVERATVDQAQVPATL